MTQTRKIIVHIATSADGYIARPDGNLDWLTKRPAPKGFYDMPQFMRTVDAKLIGRKTYDLSVEMGAHFSADDRHYVFSRQPPPASVPAGVEFVSQSLVAFARRLRNEAGKNIWLMGGGEIIASFLDEDLIDEVIITVVPIFIGEGLPTHRTKASRRAAETAFRKALSRWRGAASLRGRSKEGANEIKVTSAEGSVVIRSVAIEEYALRPS